MKYPKLVFGIFLGVGLFTSIFFGFSDSNIISLKNLKNDSDKMVDLFNSINQTDITYTDTHLEPIDGPHWATINKTEIIDENTMNVMFRENGFRFNSYVVPTFELTKIVNKGDKFIVTCIELSDALRVSIFQFVEITNETIYFHHYNSGDIIGSECKYPDIIQHSFNFDWEFEEVKQSDILELSLP